MHTMEKWGKIRVIRVSGRGLDCNGLGKVTSWEGHLKVKELAMWISGGKAFWKEGMVSAKALDSSMLKTMQETLARSRPVEVAGMKCVRGEELKVELENKQGARSCRTY